jgi:hypothetical protein
MPASAAITRRSLLAAALGAPACASLPARPASAQDGADSAAEALLRAGAEAMAAVRSFHFSLTTPQGRTSVMNALTLRAVEGDVLRPDRFQARIEAMAAAVIDVTVTIIGIGDRLWISDPRSGGATWIEMEPGGDAAGASGTNDVLALLANPDLIFLAALSVLSDPALGADGVIDGEPVRRIDGIVDLRQITERAGVGSGIGSDEALPTGIVPDPLPASIWFDAANRPRRIELEGAILPGEDGTIIRRLDLTEFDAPVRIEPPLAATPLAGA